MKNVIIVDIDTDRKEQPMILAKPNDESLPKDDTESKKKSVLDDIKTLTEALAFFVRHSDKNGYATKEALLEAITRHISTDPNQR